MITIEASQIIKDFSSSIYGDAYTLSPDAIGNNDSGWTIVGEVHEDYYEWVNDFEATHPVFGRVWGNFEDEVYADSLEAYKHFVEHHPPENWDYGDI